MIRKLLVVTVAAMWIASCGGQATDDVATVDAPAEVTLANFETTADDYVGKTIVVTGTVDHVCKHGGKKMFIIGTNPEDRLKITATSDVSVFDVALEGSDVRIEGVVEVLKMDEAYLATWKGDVCSHETIAQAADAHAACADSTGKEHAEHEGEIDQIESLRKQLEESGDEYLAFYNLACRSFTEL